MTTEQLRKEITVIEWSINNKGISIRYSTKGKNANEYKYILFNQEESARLLTAIGSIDSYSTEIVLSVNWEGCDFNWTTFLMNYTLSQWEALTLVIRHEMEKALEKDSNLLEMDKAIEALKNI